MDGLIFLGGVVESLKDAHTYARQAEVALEGARASRAGELVTLLADALVFAERLEFICEGDIRNAVEPLEC